MFVMGKHADCSAYFRYSQKQKYGGLKSGDGSNFL